MCRELCNCVCGGVRVVERRGLEATGECRTRKARRRVRRIGERRKFFCGMASQEGGGGLRCVSKGKRWAGRVIIS